MFALVERESFLDVLVSKRREPEAHDAAWLGKVAEYHLAVSGSDGYLPAIAAIADRCAMVPS